MATGTAEQVGRQLRERVPRRSHAAVVLPEDRDPVGLLEAQHTSRLADLVPVRVGRMLQSPFAFYRGSAAVMAADLRAAPTTAVDVVSCGDAHISNFGFFASPERELVFDLNDFDEGGVAPWEWDLRRLAASVHIGGRDAGLAEDACRDAVRTAVESYRTTLREDVAYLLARVTRSAASSPRGTGWSRSSGSCRRTPTPSSAGSRGGRASAAIAPGWTTTGASSGT